MAADIKKWKSEWHAARRVARKVAGLCVRCGKPCDRDDCVECDRCNKKQRAIYARRYRRLPTTRCACGAELRKSRTGRCRACFHEQRRAGLKAGTWKHNWRKT